MTETHYNCGGQLVAKDYGQEYTCQRCGAVVRASVIEEIERFERVAAGDGELATIARIALEGVGDA